MEWGTGVGKPVRTVVNLPKGRTPVFPDRCVACGIDHPGATHRVGTNAIGWWTLAFWSFGPRFWVEAPACVPCCGRMRRQRWLQLAVNAAFIVVGVSIALALLQRYEGPFKRWIALGIALVCLLPVFLWETLFSRPIDMTAFSSTVDYEFRDAAYGNEFAALNQRGAGDEGHA